MYVLVDDGAGQQAAPEVLKLLSGIILPREVSGVVVSRYVRKAVRVGVWRKLRDECRALLIAAKSWGVIKSPTLRSILHKIFLEIELHTLKGKALFYGVIIFMRDHAQELKEALRNVQKLLVVGISYLNNPPIYRVYG